MVPQSLELKKVVFPHVSTSVLRGHVTTDKFMLLQKVSGFLDSLAYVTRIARAEVVFAFKVNAHVVGLVG